jgi:hypothetical protein
VRSAFDEGFFLRQPLGFVLVTHTQPEQIVFLCRTLTDRFGGAPIAIHHDVSKCELPLSRLPSNVSVVKNPVATAWASIGIVQGYLLALGLLYETASPDWAVSLSAADYLATTPERILAYLQATTADVLMDFRELKIGTPEPADACSPGAVFHTPYYIESAYSRLVTPKLHNRIRRTLFGNKARIRPEPKFIERWFTPFNDSFRPYAGDTWHTLNRRAAEVLLRKDDKARELMHFYRRRFVPDEGYYQPILLNSPGLRFENNNRRYTLWDGSGDQPHPATLTVADVDAIAASGSHFARKFAFDLDVYRAMDEAIARWDRSNR